jgi:hypothetical protein
MEAATGERIVAFGRVGKPVENRFFTAIPDRHRRRGMTSCNGF